jgi:hypothetical protein
MQSHLSVRVCCAGAAAADITPSCYLFRLTATHEVMCTRNRLLIVRNKFNGGKS